MARAITITAAQATLPEAITVAQRVLPGEIVYPFLTWLADRRAGRRDARLLKAMLAKDPVLSTTPWMLGLRGGYLTAAARDRRETTALQAPLRHDAVAAIARILALEGRVTSLNAAVEEARAAPVDDKPTSAGEAAERPAERLRRHQRSAKGVMNAASAQVSQNRTELEELTAQLAELAEQHAFHETVLNHRIEALRSFYSKRQSVYLQHGLRGASHDGIPPIAPAVEIPNWPAAPFPTLDPDSAFTGVR